MTSFSSYFSQFFDFDFRLRLPGNNDQSSVIRSYIKRVIDRQAVGFKINFGTGALLEEKLEDGSVSYR